MTTKCAECESGPTGHGGHEKLFSHAFRDGNVLMKCRACGSYWTRVPDGPDAFNWVMVSASEGALLPSG